MGGTGSADAGAAASIPHTAISLAAQIIRIADSISPGDSLFTGKHLLAGKHLADCTKADTGLAAKTRPTLVRIHRH